MSETVISPAEASNELVALYLLASVAASEPGVVVNIKDGIPVISAQNKDWVLKNYVDCLRTIMKRAVPQ